MEKENCRLSPVCVMESGGYGWGAGACAKGRVRPKPLYPVTPGWITHLNERNPAPAENAETGCLNRGLLEQRALQIGEHHIQRGDAALGCVPHGRMREIDDAPVFYRRRCP